MTIFQALVLGIVQGLTEFLPVSSSAHLVIVPYLFGWQIDPAYAFAFDVLVQMGTLLAVIVFFAPLLGGMLRSVVVGLRRGRPFEDPLARLAWLILLATIPAVVAGLLLHDLVAAAFGTPAAVFAFLLVTGALLAASERYGRPERALDGATRTDALIIGSAQALAIFPGISRSGSTISTGLLRRFRRPDAARFSFLMSIPVMIGAGAVGLKDLAALSPSAGLLLPVAVGFAAAAIVGYLAIRWMLAYLAGHRLTVFAVYCFVVGLLGLASVWLRG
ncbi:MAG TPA: undecaprenyl-diphosphate phosphatase [Anaerolineales bacterium]|nr:undecaprenyl-diphosphate phosphatase [Anaerolineales bacterium]